MTNLFSFGKKELTQDAIIRWIFESWNDVELKPVVNKLFKEFGVGISTDNIKELHTFSQVKDVDISVVIETNDDKIYMLFIEDKTTSGVHDNQLIRYNGQIFGEISKNKYEYAIFSFLNERGYSFSLPKTGEIKEDGNLSITRIFYKSDYLTEEDVKHCKEAGWIYYNIDKIVSIFEEFKDINNIIFKQYYNHLVERQFILCYEKMPNEYLVEKKLSLKTIPIDDERRLWVAYLKNTIAPKLDEKLIEKYNSDNHRIEVYHFQGGNDIGMAVFNHEQDLAHIKLQAGNIKKDSIKIQLQIYGNESTREKDGKVASKNAWYKEDGNKKDIENYMNEIKFTFAKKVGPLNCNKNEYVPEIKYSKTLGDVKIMLEDKELTSDFIVNSIMECYEQLRVINERISLRREPYVYPGKKENKAVSNFKKM